MRCLKCGYISFDFNQICPKCNKDISDYQDKMNIPSFRPNPPSLLGALIGETDESDLGIDISSAPEKIPEPESHTAFDESLELQEDMELNIEQDAEETGLVPDAEEISLDESSEITAEEDVLDFDLGTVEAETSLAPEASAPDESEPIDSTKEPEIDETGISLDLEDLSFESEETGPAEVIYEKQEELSLGADDITLDERQEDTALDHEKEKESASGIDSQEFTTEEKEVADEIELKLDDLKINETGDLEIETVAEAEKPIGETTLADDTSLDGSPLGTKKGDGEKTLITDESQPEITDLDLGAMDKGAGFQDNVSENVQETTSIADEPLNLNEISIDDNELDLSDDFREIEDLSLDESQGDEELSLDENIGLDDLTSDKSGSDEETPLEPTLDLDLDLENLDLDLDLDNAEEK